MKHILRFEKFTEYLMQRYMPHLIHNFIERMLSMYFMLAADTLKKVTIILFIDSRHEQVNLPLVEMVNCLLS